MKILYLNDDWPPQALGGAAKVAFDLARKVAEKGHEVGVITTVRNRKEEGVFQEEGIKVYRIYSNYKERWRAWLSLYNFQTVAKIKEIIQEFKPEVVHVHNVHYYLSYACLKVAKKSGAKVFMTMHDVMSFTYGKLKTKRYLEDLDGRVSFWNNLKLSKKRFNPFRNLIIRHYLRYVDEIWAVSQALRRVLEINRIRVDRVVYNGVDVQEIKATEVPKDKKILFGGRLSPAKGGEILKEVVRELREKNENISLMIFGKKEKSGEEEGVENLGFLRGEDLEKAFRKARIVVVPSLCFDSLPTVILEAMANGRPVIATRYGGSREMILEKETGYIVNPFKKEEIKGRIEKLLNNYEKAKKMGERARDRVEKSFNLEDIAERVISYYKYLIK